jgi:hypothetical protein
MFHTPPVSVVCVAPGLESREIPRRIEDLEDSDEESEDDVE